MKKNGIFLNISRDSCQVNIKVIKKHISKILYWLTLSHTEHGWAHSSNTVYSVIQGLTGTSIELQPCLGMRWYTGSSKVCHSLNMICTTIFIQLLYSSKYGSKYGLLRPSTIKHDFYSINQTFTGFTYGRIQSHTASYGLVWLPLRLYKDMAPVSVF